MSKLYYTEPTDQLFNELKAQAMFMWKMIDTDNDKYGYATEKINLIKHIPNISDNFMSIFAMFDINNQRRLAMILSEECKKAINDRLIDGGATEYLI